MRDSWDKYKEMMTEISEWPRSRSKDSELGLNRMFIGHPLLKAPTGMFCKRLSKTNAEQPYWRPTTLLGRCWRRMNITPDGHRVRATGCKRCSDISRLAYNAMHEGLESASPCEYISKMYLILWKPPGVSERMWSVNLDASNSGEYQTLGGHSCRPSE